jgi:16S rRNA U516 pseudouridylate synthase RsuA-like enzyme
VEIFFSRIKRSICKKKAKTLVEVKSDMGNKWLKLSIREIKNKEVKGLWRNFMQKLKMQINKAKAILGHFNS